jgi:hypothetical protein
MADAPNTNTAGKILASVGDGSNTSQWRNPVTVWTNADSVSATDIVIDYSYIYNIATVEVSGGFSTYLFIFSFRQGSGTPPTSTTEIDVGIKVDGTHWTYDQQIGWMGPTGFSSFSGTWVWSPITDDDKAPFTAVLGATTYSGSAPVAFGCITVIGIS